MKLGQVVFDNNKEIGIVYQVKPTHIIVQYWIGCDPEYLNIKNKDQVNYQFRDSIWSWNGIVPLDLYQNKFQQKQIDYYVSNFNRVKQKRNDLNLFNNSGLIAS